LDEEQVEGGTVLLGELAHIGWPYVPTVTYQNVKIGPGALSSEPPRPEKVKLRYILELPAQLRGKSIQTVGLMF
jgi:hypothetical protein